MSAAGGPSRPIPNSYWVREGRFAAGEYPGALDPRDAAAKVRTLIEAGVDCFMDLTQRRDGLAPYEQIAHEQGAGPRPVGAAREPSDHGHGGAAPGRGDGGHPRRHRRRPRRGSHGVCALLGRDRPHRDGGRLLAGPSRASPAQGGARSDRRVVAARGEELAPHRVAPDPPPAGLRAAVGRPPPPLAGVAGPGRRRWAG